MELAFDMQTDQSSANEKIILYLKIKNVLFKLISPEFRLSHDCILTKFFDGIRQIFISEDFNDELVEVFLPWIDAVSKDWNNINPATCAFSLRILALLCADQKQIPLLSESAILTDICADILKDSQEKSVLSAYLEFVNSVITHENGCMLIWRKGIWKEVLHMSVNTTCLYVLRQTHQIISNFITSMSANNEYYICQKIIDEIFLPCTRIVEEKTDSLENLIMRNLPYHDECFYGKMKSLNYIVLLREIVLNMLHKRMKYAEIDMILGIYNLQEWICDTMDKSTNNRVVAELSRLLCVINIAYLPHLESGSVNYSRVCILRQQFLDHCNILIKKHQFILIQEVCVKYLKLWNLYGGDVVYDMDENDTENVTYAIENTVLFILAVPLFIYIRVGGVTTSDLMNAFAEKVFGVACLRTTRTAFAYKKEVRLRTNDMKLESIASSSNQCFIRLADVCKKEQAVLIFQTLVHILKKIIPLGDNIYLCELNKPPDLSEPDKSIGLELLSSTIEALNCYISKFDLSWSDSLETVCVMPLIQKLITAPDITPRMATDILRLQRTVLLSYLPTNLALLMDTIEGTTLGKIGNQLFKNLHSVHWEIRDSALELLQVICSLSEHKFTVFQKVILDANLPEVVMSAYENDREPYVRCSALSCLNYMVRMQFLWDGFLSTQNILAKLQKTLLHEQEGIVRTKAVLLLREIYSCRGIRPEQLEEIINVLYHITIKDLYWEVKNSAILFWDTILEKRLTEEGMVDGQFPDHLFARETRKIIKLTPLEISSRVRKVLESLCDYGCLYALWYLTQDDCDLEVSKEVGKFIMKMIDLIKKFNVPMNKHSPEVSLDEERTGLKRKISDEADDVTMNGVTQSSDDVIESIVSEGDVDLVCELLRSTSPQGDSPRLQPRRKLSVDLFYSFTKDLDFIGKEIEKARWLHSTSESITSLLDDILLANQCELSKDMITDCY